MSTSKPSQQTVLYVCTSLQQDTCLCVCVSACAHAYVCVCVRACMRVYKKTNRSDIDSKLESLLYLWSGTCTIRITFHTTSMFRHRPCHVCNINHTTVSVYMCEALHEQDCLTNCVVCIQMCRISS